jgi:hypothetical protein
MHERDLDANQGLFESRALRYIFGAVQDKFTWRKKYNHKFYKLFNEPDITKYIKIKK